jgi:hypothetical protein
MIFFSAAEGLSLVNSTKSPGEILILFRKPSNFLSYGSLVAGLLEVLEMRFQFRNAQRKRKSLLSGRIKREMVALVYLIYIDDTVFCNSPSSFFINLSRLFCSSFILFSLSPYHVRGRRIPSRGIL